MKNIFKYRFLFISFLSILIVCSAFQNLYSQNNTKKHKVRLKAYYFKIMDSVSYFDIKASSKIDKKSTKVSNIEITVFNVQKDQQIKLGSTITNNDGEAKFILKDLNLLEPDSTGIYTFVLKFKGTNIFKKATKKVTFKNVEIFAKLITKDSVNYMNAKIIDEFNKKPIIDKPLMLRVQRLFKPLILENGINMTDETGSILTQIEDGIPGVDGNLTFEVVLFESDEYGTVVDLVDATIGVPIVDESTFDKRTMWSPRNKTPLFLLILSNVLTLGMWAIIILLIINLFKIYEP